MTKNPKKVQKIEKYRPGLQISRVKIFAINSALIQIWKSGNIFVFI